MILPKIVNDFLNECRILIDSQEKRKDRTHLYVDLFLNDPETKATINLLAYSTRNVLQELKELKAEDLFDGPTPDRNSKYPGELFIFKKVVGEHFLYIKLKIRVFGGKKQLFMMSFHPDRP